nr:MAG TPA: minor tail protein [Caudoviricetes sp.]
MADEIKLMAPTVEQNVVVKVEGQDQLKALSDTMDKMSNNKNLQKYFKTQQELINATADAYDNFQKKASKDNASELLKITNALKALSGTDLSNIMPDFNKITKSLSEAERIIGSLDSAFSVNSFKDAFNSFETLQAYGTDIQKLFSHFGVSSNIGELQQNVKALENEVGNLTNRLTNVINAKNELQAEFDYFKTGSGMADKLDELENYKNKMTNLRREAQQMFESFLSLNNISIHNTDEFGDLDYGTNRFQKYFSNIEAGSWSAIQAIENFKSEYDYLLKNSFKSNNSLGVDQLQEFSTKLNSIFQQVQDTSAKISEIISNGVIAKSVQNLSIDESLTTSQRSLFGDLLKDEESLRSITTLIQKLIEESNQTKDTEIFNSEQFAKIEELFTNIESHLSSIKGVLVDVGDGEELSPLLKQLDNIREATSNIKLSLNLDFGSEISEKLNQKISQVTTRQLEAYRKLFSAMKSTGKTNKEMLNFYEPENTSTTELIGMYQSVIKRARNHFKVDGNDIYEKLLGSTYKDLNREINNANRQLSETENKRPDSGILGDLFGNSKDLSGVIEQLNTIVSKLDEISASAKGFTETFKNGLNVNASVEEIEKLTNRVKELEAELVKIKTPTTVAAPQESNISSGSNPAIEQQNKLQEEINETANDFNNATDSSERFSSKVENDFNEIISIIKTTNQNIDDYVEKWKLLKQVGRVGDNAFSAKFQKNNGQIEDWYFTKNNSGTYEVANKLLTTDYKNFEKTIISAENKLRDLESQREAIVSKSSNASTNGIDRQITYQRDYVNLLDQTAQYLRQNNETLLQGAQIEMARNKAAQEYYLNKDTKNDVKNASQVASDEQKRQKSIEQTNRLLNKQQIIIDGIEKSYSKAANNDLDKAVNSQSDLAELANKKAEIQTLLNKLNGQDRNSFNEKEFLQVEKLIAEYKQLAKDKLKANNPSKQELGGQALDVLLANQVTQYNKLISQSEKYGDATKEITNELKAQRDLIAEQDKNGVYVARSKKADGSELTANDYYNARNNYKKSKAEFTSYEQIVKVNNAISETNSLLNSLKIPNGFEGSFSILESEVKRLNNEFTSGKISASEYTNSIKKAFSNYQTPIDNKSKDIWNDLTTSLDRYTTLQKRIASNNALSTDVEEAKNLKKHIDELKESDILPKDKLNIVDEKLQQINQTVSDLKAKLKESTLDSLQGSIDKYKRAYNNYSVRPSNEQSDAYKNALINLNSAIQELEKYKATLSGMSEVTEKQEAHIEKLVSECAKASDAFKQMSASQKGAKEIGIAKSIQRINKDLAENTRYSKTAKQNLQALLNQLESGDPSINLEKINSEIIKIENAEIRAGRAGKSFLDIFKTKAVHGFLGQAQSYLSMYIGFYGMVNKVRSTITTVKELDTALVDLKKTTTMTEQQLNKFYYSSNDVARQMGVTTQEIIEQASAWSRLNKIGLLYGDI